MCSCSEVSQSVKVPVTQMPASTSRPAIAQMPSPLPMNAAWQEAPISIRRRPAARTAAATAAAAGRRARADAEAGRDDRPRLRAVQLVRREHRAEHEDRRQHDHVVRAMPPRKAVTHERLRTSDQPSLRLVRSGRSSLSGPRRASPSAPSAGAAGSGRRWTPRTSRRRTAARRPDRRRSHQQPAEHRADDGAGRVAQAAQGVGRLQVHRRDRAGQQAGEGGREERVGGAVDRSEHRRGGSHRAGRSRAASRRRELQMNRATSEAIRISLRS